jgi:hypothetical protein
MWRGLNFKMVRQSLKINFVTFFILQKVKTVILYRLQKVDLIKNLSLLIRNDLSHWILLNLTNVHIRIQKAFFELCGQNCNIDNIALFRVVKDTRCHNSSALNQKNWQIFNSIRYIVFTFCSIGFNFL